MSHQLRQFNVNTSQLTPWFDGQVRPARPGVYVLESGGPGKELGFQYWDGTYWYTWRHTPEKAEYAHSLGEQATANYQYDRWRGLKRKPKEA